MRRHFGLPTRDGLTAENAVSKMDIARPMPGRHPMSTEGDESTVGLRAVRPSAISYDNEVKHRAETGNAAVDGYTVEARRLPGDPPGEMVDADEADRIEAASSGGEY